jgi:predicted dithiol-disulfide oxidoreductase (DUF899 family)
MTDPDDTLEPPGHAGDPDAEPAAVDPDHTPDPEARGDGCFDSDQPFEMPGRRCFLDVVGRVFHTYSQYARGLESTGGVVLLPRSDRLGRQEDWEEPKGRSQSAPSATPDFAS